MDILTLGERILIYRHRAGLTQEALAAKINVKCDEINQYENDVLQPDKSHLEMLAAEFNKSIDELMYGV